MGRGGRRSGTPGVGYSNRTDLAMARAPQQGTETAAAGGQGAPMPPPQTPQVQGLTPDDTPSLFDPGDRSKPITSGLPTGAGPGPVPPAPTASSTVLTQYLPEFERVARREGTPESFKGLVRYLQGQ